MGNYYTGYYTGMTDEQVAEQDYKRQQADKKRQAKQRMEMIRYEVNREDNYRAKNHNYLTPLEKDNITIEEYMELKNAQ